MNGRVVRTLIVVALCVALAAILAVSVAAQEQQPISLTLKDADIRDALDMLFRGSGKNYVLGPGAAGRVTMSLQGRSFDEALRQLLDVAVPPLTYRLTGDTYTVIPKGAAPATGQAATTTYTTPDWAVSGGNIPSTAQVGTAQGKEEIQLWTNLMWAAATDIAGMFGGSAVGVGGVSGGGGGVAAPAVGASATPSAGGGGGGSTLPGAISGL
jgi:hypothetical protein